MEKIKVNIHGSCVTRDAFEICEHWFKVDEYISRNSIFSALSDRLEINMDRVDCVLDSLLPWEQKCIYTDIYKNTFDRLSKSNAEILIIDLIDERHLLVKAEKEIYMTNSVYFQQANMAECLENVEGIVILLLLMMICWKRL